MMIINHVTRGYDVIGGQNVIGVDYIYLGKVSKFCRGPLGYRANNTTYFALGQNKVTIIFMT